MSGKDGELEELRAVSCAALLERLPPPWQLDKAESSRACLKYRRGRGEILLVTHEGRGWASPRGAEGSVRNLNTLEGSMAGKRTRRRFTAEFKVQAAKRVVENG